MNRTQLAVSGLVACAFAFAMPAAAQGTAAKAAPHTIEIKLIDKTGPAPYAFEPTNITAQRGDTLRFVQAASTMHNVHFIATPAGAKLGSAATSQYLTTKGQAFTVVVDSRFTDGKYEIVCDPHATIGMHAFLSVTSGTR